MNEDCSDIRLINSDESETLDYWLKSGCNTSSTDLRFEIPSIGNNESKTFYMYYGNPQALSKSELTIGSTSNPAKSCNQVYRKMEGSPNRSYEIDPDEDGSNLQTVRCDMGVNDTGWELLYNYDHVGGTNPDVVEGTWPSDHSSLSHQDKISDYGFSQSNVNSLRLRCETSNHDRIVHYTTKDSTAIDGILDNSTSVSYTDITNVFYKLPEHTGNLPDAAGSDTGESEPSEALFGPGFPMFKSGNYHWSVGEPNRGGNRWECDAQAGDDSEDTLHQIWFKGETDAPLLSLTPNYSIKGESAAKSLVNQSTYLGQKPRSFFAENQTVRIEAEGNYAEKPDITIYDSNGTKASQATMENISGTFEHNYTVNGTEGWYKVEIGTNVWENAFYRGERWQDNFTDSDGNKFTFRRKLNVSEPGIGDRWFEPIDVNVDFGFSPNNDSIRLVSWNGSRMLEIPSQLYNRTQSDGEISNANLVFLTSLNKSETRTYYIVSSKTSYKKNYSGINNTDTGLDERVENSRFEAFFNQSMGYLMRDVKSKIGSDQSLSGSEPMDYYPELTVGLTNFKARIDNTATVNTVEGPLFTKINVTGNLNDVDDKPYTVECSIYASNNYMECEKNLTAKNSETWSNFYFNGLVVEDGKFSYISYMNSSNIITTESMSSGSGTDHSSLDSNMKWLTFYNNNSANTVAEIFLDDSYGPTDSPSFSISDGSNNEYFRQSLISSDADVSSGDYYYSKTARVFYNGLKRPPSLNSTYRRLKNPASFTKGEEKTDDKIAANYSNTGNVSTNDSSSAKVHSYWSDDTFLDYAEIDITGNGPNGSNTELYYNDSYTIRENGDFTNTSWVNITLNNDTINAGKISANITVYDVAGKSNSTLIEFNITDATSPEYDTVINRPNESSRLDPDVRLNVTANITEYSNISQAHLYYKNDSVTEYTKKLMDRKNEANFTHTYKSNFTPLYEDNYTYYVSTNDTLDQRRNSSKTNITVTWDYTWNLNSNFNSKTATFNKNVSIGNFTINNTGDFNQTFKLSTGTFNSRTWVNGTRLPGTFEVGNGSSKFLTLNATTRDPSSTEGVDTFNLTIENASASPNLNFSSFDVTTSTGGPFLFTEITEYNSTVNPGDSDIDLKAKVTNKGNETANTVNITFKLPDDWSVSEGESLQSNNFLQVDVGTSESFSTKADVASDSSTGTKTVKAISRSEEDNRSTTVDVTVESKSSGGGNNGNSGSDGGGGSGGGGTSGSGGAGGTSLTTEQQQKLFQTEETFELVRGQDQKFILTVENPFKKGELENVRVNVTGFLSQYLRVEPKKLERISVNESRNFTIHIAAPKYFSRGEYSLNFNITGFNNQTEKRPAGNDTVLVGDVNEFRENREVKLIVHEISREKASESLNKSQQAAEELEKEEVLNAETRELLSQAEEALNSGNYQKARQLSQQIEAKKQQAETARETIQEVKRLIDDASYRGLDAPKTERMTSMATAALERGDYGMAANRAEEAKNLYALETKGEINYLNLVQRKWEQVTIAMVILAFMSISGFYRLRLFRINRKLSKLENEEETLLGLMKQVQRESFEEGKMSMEEYEEAMMQYEKQLSQNVKDTVRLESEKAHWLNIRKGRERFEHERDRIRNLMQETQKKYLDQGEIETRVYKQKMQSFRERLTELEGRLAEMEAQRQIEKETGIKGSVNNIIRRIKNMI